MSDPRISQSDAELRSHVVRVLESQYEVEKEIGRGGMGIVYRATDLRLERTVALKVLPRTLQKNPQAIRTLRGVGYMYVPPAH